MPRKSQNTENLTLEEIIIIANKRARIAASSGYPLNEEKLFIAAAVYKTNAQSYIDAYKRSHALNFGKKKIEDIVKKRAYTCARAQSNRVMITNDATLMGKAKALFPEHADLYVKYYKEAQTKMISRKLAQTIHSQTLNKQNSITEIVRSQRQSQKELSM